MALSPLTAQLPSLAGTLPDLVRRADSLAPRAGDSGAGDSATLRADLDRDDAPAATDHRSDDTARMLARHAALGPLTYARRMVPFDAPASAPVGMRGANLDVRG